MANPFDHIAFLRPAELYVIACQGEIEIFRWRFLFFSVLHYLWMEGYLELDLDKKGRPENWRITASGQSNCQYFRPYEKKLIECIAEGQFSKADLTDLVSSDTISLHLASLGYYLTTSSSHGTILIKPTSRWQEARTLIKNLHERLVRSGAEGELLLDHLRLFFAFPSTDPPEGTEYKVWHRNSYT